MLGSKQNLKISLPLNTVMYQALPVVAHLEMAITSDFWVYDYFSCDYRFQCKNC